MTRKTTFFNTVLSGLVLLFLPYMLVNSMVNIFSYGSSGVHGVFIVAVMLLVLGYFYPALSAARRRHAKRFSIVGVNFSGFAVGMVVFSDGLQDGLPPVGVFIALICWAIALLMLASEAGCNSA